MWKYFFSLVVVPMFCRGNFILNQEKIFGYPLKPLNNLFVNLDLLAKYSQTICVVDGSELSQTKEGRYRTKDFYEEIVTYLQHQEFPGLKLSKPIQMPVCKDKRCTRVKMKSKFSMKRIIFLTFDTYKKFIEAIFVDRWAFFKRASTSFYIVVMMDRQLMDVPCSSANFTESLNRKMGDLFNKVWVTYQISDIFVFMPFLCGDVKVMKFDPVGRCKGNDCSDMMIMASLSELRKITIEHKRSNFKGYPLRISLFQRNPTLLTKLPRSLARSHFSKDTKNVGTIGGVDGFFLGNLIKYLNFTPVIIKYVKQDYGYMFPNGTYTGTVGDVIYGKSDISINGRFMKPYDTDDIVFTYPLYSDEFCLVTPKAGRIPNWLSIFQVFHVSTWVMLLSTAGLMGVIWFVIRSKWSPTTETADFSGMFTDVLLLIVSRPMKMPFFHGERIFIFVCFFFNLMFSALFQGYLTTAYSTTTFYKDINTLEEVDKSGMEILVSPSIGDIFPPGVSPTIDNLRSKVNSIAVPYNIVLKNSTAKRKLIYAERKSDAKLLMELKFTSENFPASHVVEECPRYFYLCFIVHKRYPFLIHINRFIWWLTSAGLIRKWYDVTVHYSLLAQRIHKNNTANAVEKLSLTDLQTAYFLIGFGLTISTCVFIFELLSFQWFKRSHKKVGFRFN